MWDWDRLQSSLFRSLFAIQLVKAYRPPNDAKAYIVFKFFCQSSVLCHQKSHSYVLKPIWYWTSTSRCSKQINALPCQCWRLHLLQQQICPCPWRKQPLFLRTQGGCSTVLLAYQKLLRKAAWLVIQFIRSWRKIDNMRWYWSGIWHTCKWNMELAFVRQCNMLRCRSNKSVQFERVQWSCARRKWKEIVRNLYRNHIVLQWSLRWLQIPALPIYRVVVQPFLPSAAFR